MPQGMGVTKFGLMRTGPRDADDDEHHFSKEYKKEDKTVTFKKENCPTVLFWVKKIADSNENASGPASLSFHTL